jgi:putative ABC transport system substrate-binding protein
MRRLILLIIALATLLPSLAFGYDVLVLQSRHDSGHDEALKGFRAGGDVSQRLVVLSDYTEVDVVRIVREDRPALILVIGDAALTATRNVRTTKVISIMALGLTSRSNLTGVSMFAAPDHYCTIFKQLKVKRIGIIHSPAKSGLYLQQAQDAAQQASLELVVRKVTSPLETVQQLATLAGKVDVLWILPDSTAISRESVEAYFRFAQQNNIPLVSFASGHLGLGAVAIVEIDMNAVGRQAADMATALLNGNDNGMTRSAPKSVKIKTNPTVLKKFGFADKLSL